MECLWFCFSDLIQQILDDVKEEWNTHYIRESRYDTVRGRPDTLYYLPGLSGGANHFLLPVPQADINYVRSHIVETEEDNLYQEYFNYVLQSCNFNKPTDWTEALDLYNTLLEYAN